MEREKKADLRVQERLALRKRAKQSHALQNCSPFAKLTEQAQEKFSNHFFLPAPHLLQLALPTGDTQPDGHISQCEDALIPANVFSGHTTQFEPPFIWLIVPGMHSMQVA